MQNLVNIFPIASLCACLLGIALQLVQKRAFDIKKSTLILPTFFVGFLLQFIFLTFNKINNLLFVDLLIFLSATLITFINLSIRLSFLKEKFGRKHLSNFLFPILFLVTIVFGSTYAAIVVEEYNIPIAHLKQILVQLFELNLILYVIAYNLYQASIFKQYKRTHPDVNTRKFYLAKRIIISSMLFSLISIVNKFYKYYAKSEGLYYYDILIIYFSVVLVLYFGYTYSIKGKLLKLRTFRYKRVDKTHLNSDVQQPEIIEQFAVENPQCNQVEDKPDISIFEKKIKDLMDNQKPFLRRDYSVHDLSKDLDLPQKSVSKYLNQAPYTGFNDFINFYRIHFAIEMFKNNKFKNYTLEAVSYTSGFGNRTTFIAAFKKVTGYTPSEYAKKNMAYEE